MKIIKPYADEREILSRIEYAEANGALAVGMDVEHAVNVEDAEDSVVMGLQMKQPTLAELEKYIRATKLPFFIKGALSAADAIRRTPQPVPVRPSASGHARSHRGTWP